MGDSTVPNTYLYAKLPRKFKTAVSTKFEKETGNALKPYVGAAKRTLFTSIEMEIFNISVQNEYDTWQAQVRSGEYEESDDHTEA